MNRPGLEAIIWYQARHLASDDRLTRATAMDAILEAVDGYAEAAAGPIVARRRLEARGPLPPTPSGRRAALHSGFAELTTTERPSP
jgi:hypothetical protein